MYILVLNQHVNKNTGNMCTRIVINKVTNTLALQNVLADVNTPLHVYNVGVIEYSL